MHSLSANCRRLCWILTSLLSLSFLSLQSHAAPTALPRFNIALNETTVSGLSSGGFMAVQFSVAYSSIIKGAGIIAGGPYYCARGNVQTATTICSCTGISLISPCRVAPGATGIEQLIRVTEQNAAEGGIDPTSHLARQRIWMFSGQADSVVPPPVMHDLHAYYRHYIPAANIKLRDEVPAEHAMPTAGAGNACNYLGKPFINDCGVDAAGELLQWVYGDLRPKTTAALKGRFIEFDQSEFFHDRRPAAHGMAASGLVYVPEDCDKERNTRCRLHIAFHGCQQNVDSVEDRFVRQAGYNVWADANNIIVLYPQTKAKLGSNPKACWNWFDFDRNDPSYARKNGLQMSAIKRMVDRIAGIAYSSTELFPKCHATSNRAHVREGRAYDRFFLAFAKGSNRFIGFDSDFSFTSLKQTAPDFYVLGNCG